MLAIVKTIDNVKQLVPLDKTLAPAMDIVPNNTIMKFSNTTNSLVDSGWKEITQCNGQIRALTLSGDVSHRAIDITRSYLPNTWGTYNWECPNRDRIAIGAGNSMNGYGYKQIYGFANVACPMNDATTILIGSVNAQCYGATSGLALGIGVYNYFYHKSGTAISYGLSNCSYGICSADLPAECAACDGIAETTVVGINNKICTAWSGSFGNTNISGGWASINSEDPETHALINHKAVGTIYAFGNNNTGHGAGVFMFGHTNTSCYALNSIMLGMDNHANGYSAAGYKYNQFMFGIANCSCGYENVLIGTSNCTCASESTAIGRWNCIGACANGGLAIGQAADAYYCCGFLRSLIRAGGSSNNPGSSIGTREAVKTWMVSGCGTLLDFYCAVAHGGLKQDNFMGDLRLSLGSTCVTVCSMNKYTATAYQTTMCGDLWFTDGSFSMNDNVEWFLSGQNTHDNYIIGNIWEYRNCPVTAHITMISG